MSRASHRVGASEAFRGIALRCAVLVLLLVAYRFSFPALHGMLGNPAFLVGLIPCFTAAILFGLRGAVVVVVVVQLIDRSFALTVPGPEMGRVAAVTASDSGQRGIELFSQEPDAIDLVVLDLTMPGKPGEEILDELRLVRGNVPVVITSGFQAQDASKLLDVPNVIGFLDKPHTLGNLESALAALGTRLASTGAA